MHGKHVLRHETSEYKSACSHAGSLQNVNERIMRCEASQHNHSCVTVADSYHHVTKGILPNATVL
jgi:hypothetical protein